MDLQGAGDEDQPGPAGSAGAPRQWQNHSSLRALRQRGDPEAHGGPGRDAPVDGLHHQVRVRILLVRQGQLRLRPRLHHRGGQLVSITVVSLLQRAVGALRAAAAPPELPPAPDEHEHGLHLADPAEPAADAAARQHERPDEAESLAEQPAPDPADAAEPRDEPVDGEPRKAARDAAVGQETLRDGRGDRPGQQQLGFAQPADGASDEHDAAGPPQQVDGLLEVCLMVLSDLKFFLIFKCSQTSIV